MPSPRSVRLLTWPDCIDPRSLQQFEAEYAVRVEVDVVPSAAELVQRMLVNNADVDVLVPPDYAIRELEVHHRLDMLDHARLTNLRHLDTRFRRERAHDPGSRVSVIKDWGTTGFMYRTDIVNEKPESWADFWRLAEKFSGRITVLDAPAEVIGAALKMRGHSYNAYGADELRTVRSDLLRLKPHLLAFETNYKPLIASGAACLALGWNGDAVALEAQGIPIQYVIPSEGSQIWEDDWAIARHAPDPGAAHLFINFMLRPDIAAREAQYTRYGTGNRTALTLLPDEVRSDPAIYPPDEVLAKLEPGLPPDAAGAERRAALWRQIRG
jgi:spermidine/putrescine transport system substrate-binding protein